ncbi:hypothetical protein Scep_004871 [Stephania cephalantha]|uniref:UBC core domain-containing protein n=1 Tax=Stephania cephalantha TaxID=152367 RepID=A0AAP0KUZ2_9MAGN
MEVRNTFVTDNNNSNNNRYPSMTRPTTTTTTTTTTTSPSPPSSKQPKSSPNSVDTNSVTQRLQKELMSLMMSGGDLGVSAFPESENIFSWIGTIQGGKETPYEGLSYKLSLRFPVDYPFKAPQVKFETACFHPNVDQFGNICLDILQITRRWFRNNSWKEKRLTVNTPFAVDDHLVFRTSPHNAEGEFL